MTISDAHAQAARINGSTSLGPITQVGRDRSAGNAVKHGMTGSGKFLPDALRLEVEGEVALYESLYKVRNPEESRLLGIAALNGVRWHHLMKETLQVAAIRKAHAHRVYDEMRHDAVDRLLDRLPKAPRKVIPLLLRTSEGCGAMAHGWGEVHQAIAIDGWLDDEETLRMLNLLGYAKEPTKSVEAGLVAMLAALRILRRAHDPNAPADGRPAPRPESVAEARSFVMDVIEGYRERYRAMARELWETVEKDAREAAPDLVQVDPSPEGLRRARYMREADRLRRHALDELHRLRRGGAEPRPEPRKPASPPAQAQGPAQASPAAVPSRPSPPPPPSKPSEPVGPSKSSGLLLPQADWRSILSDVLPISVGKPPRRNEPNPPAAPPDPKPGQSPPAAPPRPAADPSPPPDGR